jgi:hypothetical protein
MIIRNEEDKMIIVIILLAIICLLLSIVTIRSGSKIAELEYRLTNIERDVQKEEEFRNRSHIPSGIDL